MRMKWRWMAVFVMAWLVAGVGRTHAAVTEEDLPRLLEKVFRERPDLVMDVLRSHSESVLDIAQQGSYQRRSRNLQTQWAADMKVPKTVKLAGRPMLGSSSARVRIVAFTDFTCHYCQQASFTVEDIMGEYGKDVSLVFKALPLAEGIGPQAAAYFEALAMQDQAKAWKFYKALFADQKSLLGEGEGFLKKAAAAAGADMRRLKNDVKSKKVADILAEDASDAEKLKIEGTPFFLVNNLVVRGALPLDLFKGAVDMALGKPGK